MYVIFEILTLIMIFSDITYKFRKNISYITRFKFSV